MKISILALGVVSAFALSSCGEKSSSTERGDSSSSGTDSGIKPETVVAKAFDGLTKVYADGKYNDIQVSDADKYIVYFSASW